MKYIRYSRYAPEAAEDIDLQELMNRLSDFFLQSGFDSQYGIYELDMEKSREQHMEALREAILRALEEGDLIPPDMMEKLLENPDLSQNQELSDLVNQIVRRMEQEGYISEQQQQSAHVTHPPSETPGGQIGSGDGKNVEARFEITDKALDFLGFKTLKDLLASLGKSSFGRHDTRDLATGVESGGTSKNYEFGDTLNMDISGTLFNAVQRNGAGIPIELDYPDLMVHQCEYQSSCATVLMLDCSHSMILYGEDRFTPAKRVALALSSDSHAVSRRLTALCAFSRQRRRDSAGQIGSRASWSLLHQYPRRASAGTANSGATKERYAADCDDHGRQAFGTHARGRANLQECFWP
jgi:Ca-activated chloride channel family protein